MKKPVIIDYKRFGSKLKARQVKSGPANLLRKLLTAGRMLQADSMRMVPVDTGNLKRSADTIKSVASKTTEPAVDVVYSTDYALPVHEMVQVPHNTPSEAQAKFLEQPARENREEYIAIIVKGIL